MQTFLPYPDFKESAMVLDYRRLGKQRVEASQLIRSILDPTYSWSKHPASKMWKGYLPALTLYMNTMIEEWIERGYNNTMKILEIEDEIIFPNFIGNENFHASHRSNLLRKNKEYYSQFGWSEPDNLPYIWNV